MFMKKRLVILTKNYGYNFTGATMATAKYVEEWSAYYDEIVIYSLCMGEVFSHKNVKIKEYKSIFFLFYSLLVHEYGMKNTNYYSDDHLGVLYGILRKKYIHTYHGNWPDAARSDIWMAIKSLYFIPLYVLTLFFAKQVVNVSRYMEKYTKFINKNSVVIHNGIDVKITKKTRFYKDVCLMVGSVDKRKYLYLLKLLNLCAENEKYIKVHIYGKIVDHSLKDKLDKFCCIKFMGMVRNIPYSSYPLFLNLSKIENLSISVCEAIANNVPVICFHVGGLPEVVISGKTGLVVKPFNVNKILGSIKYLFENQIDVDASVLDDYDWHKSSKKYMHLFEDN